MLKAHEISGQVLFEEKQRFPKWLTFLLIGILLLILVGMILLAVFIEKEKSEALLGLSIALPIELAIVYLFLTSELELSVTSNGLYYRWKPLHKKFRVIEKESIEWVEMRHRPMFNYGFGWLPAFGTFYNTHNGPGLQLSLRNRKKIFFSTKDTGKMIGAVKAIISTNRKTEMREF